MTDLFKHSTFAITFTGDTPATYIAYGWPDVLPAILREIWHGPGHPDWWQDFIAEVTEFDDWDSNDRGPWRFRKEIGECCYLEILRADD